MQEEKKNKLGKETERVCMKLEIKEAERRIKVTFNTLSTRTTCCFYLQQPHPLRPIKPLGRMKQDIKVHTAKHANGRK
jgi:hypothetical protein